jgi:hypothetical protein
MEWALFSKNQGSGYISGSQFEMEAVIKKIPETVNLEVIQPGMKTSLSGFFCRQLEYIGKIGKGELIFYIGNQHDLFLERHYYQSIFKISETRIFEITNPAGGRDYNFIGGKWK